MSKCNHAWLVDKSPHYLDFVGWIVDPVDRDLTSVNEIKRAYAHSKSCILCKSVKPQYDIRVIWADNLMPGITPNMRHDRSFIRGVDHKEFTFNAFVKFILKNGKKENDR